MWLFVARGLKVFIFFIFARTATQVQPHTYGHALVLLNEKIKRNGINKIIDTLNLIFGSTHSLWTK